MGEAIARQHPAVVLRPQLDKLRALLAVALIAACGLTVAVGISASDSDELAVGIRGPLPAALPKTGFDEATRGPLPAALPKTGFDEATRGPLPAALPKTGFGEAIGQSNSTSAIETKDEAASAAAIGQSNSTSAIETKDEAASAAAIGQSNSTSAIETKDEAASAAAIGQSSDRR